jgi:hypothetical protein
VIVCARVFVCVRVCVRVHVRLRVRVRVRVHVHVRVRVRVRVCVCVCVMRETGVKRMQRVHALAEALFVVKSSKARQL